MLFGNKDIYRRLQKHLNKQPIGYPATLSGVELRLLKRFFTPDEARLAINLSYKPNPLESIYDRVKESGLSFDDMVCLLDQMMGKGVIGHFERNGFRYFFNLPLVVGMYEGQLYRLTDKFLADFDTYTAKMTFGLEFLGAKPPQMRTIPVGKSIKPEHHVTTYDRLIHLIDENDGTFVINECICRKAAAIRGNPCRKTSRLETCLALGDIAKNCVRSGVGRTISKNEAFDITRQNESDGLVLQPSNTLKVDFICACCGCCCGMLRLHKALPKPLDFWSTNYYASVNSEACKGCGTCLKRCQVGAIYMDETRDVSVVDLNRCIGCGNCVATCPSEAILLCKKPEESIPPETAEALLDCIMANKKGTMGKAVLAAKLIMKK